ncbi:hypothetical protein F4X73_15545 [Candidatus Poribacteria bacterium]|nr:hypothetical protein [Candidatus Poribacteria bacterium]MYB66103.1 hypothetical protein [Candidatus Poribacteria bacterium]MYF56050.1 hypothetical protein [Candidatus Poribacteria bacterium]
MMKHISRIASGLLTILTLGCLLGGCTVLNEAQQRRAERLKNKQRPNLYLLKASRASIKIDADALQGESDHYILKFSEDLHDHDKFNEVSERKEFALSALSYMESLYEAMYDVFGFKPEHKVHVNLHHVYQGTTRVATTTSLGKHIVVNGELLKMISGIQLDFPINMYASPGTRIHELTHAFTNVYFLPVWFSEGIAVLMQTEYGRDRSITKFDSLDRHLKLDNNTGFNQLESWQGHGDIADMVLTFWRYRYAYTVVSELRERYGHDFYIKVFALMQKDRLHEKLLGKTPTSFVVYYFSQAAGEDLVPFFKELQFDVQKWEKSDILKQIEQSKARLQTQPRTRRRN